MRERLDFLKRHEYANAYITRALEHDMKGFKMDCKRDSEAGIKSIIGLWLDDNIITFRGSYDACSEYFKAYFGHYNFYDIDKSDGEKLIEAYGDNIKDVYQVSRHYLMKLDKVLQGSDESPEADSDVGERLVELDRERLEKVKLDFQITYGIELGDYQEDCSLWYGWTDQERLYGVVCLDKIKGNLIVISNFNVIPTHQGMGYGQEMLASILRAYPSNEIILFVDAKNKPAIGLYKKNGFKIVDQLINFELVKVD